MAEVVKPQVFVKETLTRGSLHLVQNPKRSDLEPRVLDDVSYPIDKDELLKRAIGLDAPASVRDAIGRLRAGIFRSRGDLIAAVEALTSP
jgi:hypothetical protein